VRGLHVMVTKPPVKTLNEQQELVQLARKHNVLVQVEYHKRFDPMYSDSRERMRQLGDFGFYLRVTGLGFGRSHRKFIPIPTQ